MNNLDLSNVKKCSSHLLNLSNQQICDILLEVQNEILKNVELIISENKKDLELFAEQHTINHPNYDRLLLNENRILQMTNDILNVINFPYNTDNNLIKQYQTKNGLDIKQISVPLGVIGVIYESRPNVTLDVFILCFRSQNACILKGGKEAENSNKIIVSIIKQVLMKYKLEDTILLLDSSRDEIKRLITANNLIDVCIPRGGKNLINFVRQNATVPVIETGAGIVHIYLSQSGNLDYAINVIFNSKTRRVSTCNSLDTLIIHQSQLKNLHAIVNKLLNKNVEIFADDASFEILKNANYPLLQKSNEESYYTEYLDYKLSIKTVNSIEEAIEHIKKHTSYHSECIISEDLKEIETFVTQIDSSTVYVNTSTGFTDGGQFELGAEIGISTQKLHARGPMGIESLRTIKYIIQSNGLIRN